MLNMAPNLAVSHHELIRDMIISESMKGPQMADVALSVWEERPSLRKNVSIGPFKMGLTSRSCPPGSQCGRNWNQAPRTRIERPCANGTSASVGPQIPVPADPERDTQVADSRVLSCISFKVTSFLALTSRMRPESCLPDMIEEATTDGETQLHFIEI